MYDLFSEDLLLPMGGSVHVEFNGLADCPSNSYDGWGDGSIEIISDIVVNGVRSPTSAFWNGSIIYEDCEAWGNFWAVWEDHMYDGYQENDSYFIDRLPSNFDKKLDAK